MSNKRRGLVMSGGGGKGAFQVGVMSEMVEHGLEYDFVSGVSTGALQASAMSQFQKGEMAAAVELLDEIWLGLKGDKDIYKRWFFGKLAGLVNRDAFYNSSPLHKIIKKHVKDERAQACGREIRIGCCSYGKGHYWEADQNTPDLWKWVIASSGVEPYFLGYRINDDFWMDGGYRCVTPLKSAIKAGCEAIDVIITGPPKTSEKDPHDNWLGTKINAYHVGMRCVGLMSDEIFLRDAERAMQTNYLVESNHPSVNGKRKVDIRLFVPEHKLGGSLNFDPKLIRERREHGVEVAKKILGA